MSRSRAAKKARSLLIAESEPMRFVAAQVEEYAESTQPVLILGENGSGRELIARILHFSSPRRTGEFVTVHGGSAPRNLLQDTAGAASQSTLRSAARGTLLIKDLCELRQVDQRRLLRRTKTARSGRAGKRPGGKSVDVQIVGSCDMDLNVAVDAGVFSSELYEVFCERKIEVPPLRDRVADIPPLSTYLIRERGREIGRNRMTLSTRAYERLVKYPWPGNVAELKGIARRLVYRSKKSRIEAGDVDAVLPVVAERVALEDMSFEEMVRSKLSAFLRRVDGYPVENLYADVFQRVEQPMLELVMKATGGNQQRAAEILGLSRNTLRRKLAEHGLLAVRTKVKPTKRAIAAKSARARVGRDAG